MIYDDTDKQEAAYLAAFTDALREGKDDAPPKELDPVLTQTVQILERTLHPEPPPARLRYNLRREINARWPADRQAAPQESWWEALRRFLFGAGTRGAAVRRFQLVAVTLVVGALAATLVLSYTDVEVVGTVVGAPDGALLAVGVGVLIVVGGIVAWWWSSSR